MASNLETLQSAGCIAPGAKLTKAELEVIDGLSEEEVRTLIGIRTKLADAAGAASLTRGGEDPLSDVTANIIV